jgi:hypothetical protein
VLQLEAKIMEKTGLPLSSFSLELLIDPENGGDMFLRNVS